MKKVMFASLLSVISMGCLMASTSTPAGTDTTKKVVTTDTLYEVSNVTVQVYISARKSVYVITTKKDGSQYRQYLPKQIASAILKGNKKPIKK